MKSFIIDNFNWFSSKIKADVVDSYSAQVSFFIIIAFIPFVSFVLSMFQIINISGGTLFSYALDIFPEQIREFISSIFPESGETFAILSISALTALWSSSRAMLSIIKGFNAIFDCDERRNFIKLRITAIFYTFIFAIILVLTSILLIFSNKLYLAMELDRFDFIPDLANNLKYLWFFVILAVFFTFSYKVIPYKAKIKLKYCLIGGSLASFGWVGYSFFFSLFVNQNGKYATIYGSIATLVLSMLWLYFCIYILLIGGEIAVWLEKITDKKYSKK